VGVKGWGELLGARWDSLGLGGEWEEGNSVVPRFALHSGLRQSGSVLRTRFYGPTKVGPYPIRYASTRALPNLGFDGDGRERSRVRAMPTSQNRDMGHPAQASEAETKIEGMAWFRNVRTPEDGSIVSSRKVSTTPSPRARSVP
jgi:hypothetical protein